MSGWRIHGAGVAVAAGLASLGLYFFERPSPAPLAEDVAEIVAAVKERSAWWRLTGDGQPYFGVTNFVHGSTLLADIYNNGMDAARSLALMIGGAPTPHISFWWLHATNDLPDHGDVFYDRLYEWSGRLDDGMASWTVSVTNAAECFQSVASIHPDDGQTSWGGMGVPEFFSPMARVFGDATNVPVFSPGGWWRDIGNGETNYKYTAETAPFVFGRSLKRVDLREAWNVLTNLTRTAALIPPNHIACEERYWLQSAGTEYNYMWAHCDFPGGECFGDYDLNAVGPMYTLEGAWGEVAEHLEARHCSTNLNATMPVTLFQYWASSMIDWSYNENTVTPGGFKSSHDKSAAMWVSRWSQLDNIDVPYPSHDAIASGLVSRVAYYLVCHPHEFESSVGNSEYELWSWEGNIVDATRLVVPEGVILPDVVDVPTNEPGVNVIYDYTKMPVVLTHLGTFTDLEERPKLTLYAMPRTPTINALYRHYDRVKEEEDFQHILKSEYRVVDLYTQLHAAGILAIVDWKWKHCPPPKQEWED